MNVGFAPSLSAGCQSASGQLFAFGVAAVRPFPPLDGKLAIPESGRSFGSIGAILLRVAK
jgi:hypothetical protein